MIFKRINNEFYIFHHDTMYVVSSNKLLKKEKQNSAYSPNNDNCLAVSVLYNKDSGGIELALDRRGQKIKGNIKGNKQCFLELQKALFIFNPITWFVNTDIKSEKYIHVCLIFEISMFLNLKKLFKLLL